MTRIGSSDVQSEYPMNPPAPYQRPGSTAQPPPQGQPMYQNPPPGARPLANPDPYQGQESGQMPPLAQAYSQAPPQAQWASQPPPNVAPAQVPVQQTRPQSIPPQNQAPISGYNPNVYGPMPGSQPQLSNPPQQYNSPIPAMPSRAPIQNQAPPQGMNQQQGRPPPQQYNAPQQQTSAAIPQQYGAPQQQSASPLAARPLQNYGNPLQGRPPQQQRPGAGTPQQYGGPPQQHGAPPPAPGPPQNHGNQQQQQYGRPPSVGQGQHQFGRPPPPQSQASPPPNTSPRPGVGFAQQGRVASPAQQVAQGRPPSLVNIQANRPLPNQQPMRPPVSSQSTQQNDPAYAAPLQAPQSQQMYAQGPNQGQAPQLPPLPAGYQQQIRPNQQAPAQHPPYSHNPPTSRYNPNYQRPAQPPHPQPPPINHNQAPAEYNTATSAPPNSQSSYFPPPDQQGNNQDDGYNLGQDQIQDGTVFSPDESHQAYVPPSLSGHGVAAYQPSNTNPLPGVYVPPPPENVPAWTEQQQQQQPQQQQPGRKKFTYTPSGPPPQQQYPQQRPPSVPQQYQQSQGFSQGPPPVPHQYQQNQGAPQGQPPVPQQYQQSQGQPPLAQPYQQSQTMQQPQSQPLEPQYPGQPGVDNWNQQVGGVQPVPHGSISGPPTNPPPDQYAAQNQYQQAYPPNSNHQGQVQGQGQVPQNQGWDQQVNHNGQTADSVGTQQQPGSTPSYGQGRKPRPRQASVSSQWSTSQPQQHMDNHSQAVALEHHQAIAPDEPPTPTSISDPKSKIDIDRSPTPPVSANALGASALGGAAGPSDWEHFGLGDDDIDDEELFGAKKDDDSKSHPMTAELPSGPSPPPGATSNSQVHHRNSYETESWPTPPAPAPIQPHRTPSVTSSLRHAVTPPPDRQHFAPTPSPKTGPNYVIPNQSASTSFNSVSSASGGPHAYAQETARDWEQARQGTPKAGITNKKESVPEAQSFVMDDGGWSQPVQEVVLTPDPLTSEPTPSPATVPQDRSLAQAEAAPRQLASQDSQMVIADIPATSHASEEQRSAPIGTDGFVITPEHTGIQSQVESRAFEAKAIHAPQVDNHAQTDPEQPPEPIDPYPGLEPWYKDSLDRFAAMLQEESQAASDKDRTQIFTNFMMSESRLRGMRYGPSIGPISDETRSSEASPLEQRPALKGIEVLPRQSSQRQTSPRQQEILTPVSTSGSYVVVDNSEDNQYSPGGRPKVARNSQTLEKQLVQPETGETRASGQASVARDGIENGNNRAGFPSDDGPIAVESEVVVAPLFSPRHSISRDPPSSGSQPLAYSGPGEQKPAYQPFGHGYKAYTPPAGPVASSDDPDMPSFKKVSPREEDIPDFDNSVRSRDSSGTRSPRSRRSPVRKSTLAGDPERDRHGSIPDERSEFFMESTPQDARRRDSRKSVDNASPHSQPQRRSVGGSRNSVSRNSIYLAEKDETFLEPEPLAPHPEIVVERPAEESDQEEALPEPVHEDDDSVQNLRADASDDGSQAKSLPPPTPPPKDASYTLAQVLPSTRGQELHPSQQVTSLKQALNAFPDEFNFISDMLASWEAEAKKVRNKNEEDRRARQEEQEEHTDHLFSENEIGYGDIAGIEEEFKAQEIEKKAREDTDEYQSFVHDVFDVVYHRLQVDIKGLMEQFAYSLDLMKHAAAGRDALEIQSARPDLAQIMQIALALHRKVELRHLKVTEAILDRDKRNKKMVISPLYARGDKSRMKQMEKRFDEAEKTVALQAAKKREERARMLMNEIESNTMRGVGEALDYMEEISQAVRHVEDTIAGLKDDQYPGDPKPVAADLVYAKTVLHDLTQTSDILMHCFHSAALAVNLARHDVDVLAAKLENADAPALDGLLKAKQAEDDRLQQELDHRVSTVRDDFEKVATHIEGLLPRLEGLKAGEEPVVPAAKQVLDPQHQERIQRALEAAKRRNQAAEDFS